MGEALFGLCGKDFVILAADMHAGRSIIRQKDDVDKIHKVNPELLERSLYIIYIKKSSKTEVNLASQTHQTPHIGRPQRMPDISTIDVKIIPIGANDLLIKAQIGVFVIRYTKLITAIDEYIPRLSHADGTCRYMILTIAPCW